MISPRTAFASLVLCALLMITPVLAGPDWEEITDGGGDAGRLPAAAQETIGLGEILSISGTITAADLEDVYAIKITSPGSFSATVSVNSAVAGTVDSQVWLFDDAGKGILGNDNSAPRFLDPAMGSAATDNSRARVRASGRYYIAITFFGGNPINPSGAIFKLAGAAEVSGPDDAGGKFAVANWTSGAAFASPFDYTITLIGAEFANDPPPAVAGGGGGPPACTDPHPGAGGCLDPTPGIPGCRNSACCQLVCANDPNCCSVSWDLICAQSAQFMCESGGPAPPNDNCNSPSPVFPGLTPFFTVGATTDGPPHPLCDGGPPAQIFNDVWFTFTAPCTGDLTVSACGATGAEPGPFVEFDAKLAVYGLLSCNPGDLQSSLLDCNDDAPGCPLFAPSLRVPVSAGQSLLIRLGSFGPSTNETGFGALLVECVPGGGSPGCGDPAAGDCFVQHPTPGCIDVTCCETIAAMDRFCCDHNWDQHCVDKAQMLCAAKAGFEPGLIINEIRIDQPATDDDEYFELKGLPGLPLFDVSYLVIGDGAVALGSGVVETVVDLSGQDVPPDGHLLVAEVTMTLGEADLIIPGPNPLNFENSDNTTHMLVLNFHGSDGQDLDTNNDGVFDIQPWDAIIDLIAVIESPNPPVGTEFHYGPPAIGPEGPGLPPGHVYRCEPGDAWTIGQFILAGGQDTPGVVNVSCPEPTGACCLPNDLCAILTLTDCSRSGGAYQGDDIQCADVGCRAPTGACCLANGQCVVATETGCSDSGGTYQGDSTSCDRASCPQPCLGGPCPSDLNGDGFVNSLDLGFLLSSWSIPAGALGCGGVLPCCADLNFDGFVNSLDLGFLLSAWSIPPGAPGCGG